MYRVSERARYPEIIVPLKIFGCDEKEVRVQLNSQGSESALTSLFSSFKSTDKDSVMTGEVSSKVEACCKLQSLSSSPGR